MMVNVNSITLFYKKSGAGHPLLLLHGNGEDHSIFDALAAKLAAHYTVYAIDSRNHGQSEANEDFSYEAMAADMAGFIEALTLGAVDIIGFSDGAIIALLLAMGTPASVRKMALLGVNLSPADFTAGSLQFIKDTYTETGDPLFKLMLHEPNIPIAAVRDVQTPALVVAAADDIFTQESFARLAETMPNAALLIKHGHDHGSYIIGNDCLYPDLMRFLG